MKRRMLLACAILIAGAAVGIALLRPKPPPVFAFTSASIALPADDSRFPPGPHADIVAASCASCHSATMVTNQPALKPAQWQATVTKMREVYKAPIADTDVAPILTYLNDLSRRQASAR